MIIRAVRKKGFRDYRAVTTEESRLKYFVEKILAQRSWNAGTRETDLDALWFVDEPIAVGCHCLSNVLQYLLPFGG